MSPSTLAPTPFTWTLLILMSRTSPPPLSLLLLSEKLSDDLVEAPSLSRLSSFLPPSYRFILLANIRTYLTSLDSFSDSFQQMSESVGAQPTSTAVPEPLALPDSFDSVAFIAPETMVDVVEGCSGIDPKSSYGEFVRKACRGFGKMPFEVVCKLYAACQVYVQPYSDEVEAKRVVPDVGGGGCGGCGGEGGRDIFARLNAKIERVGVSAAKAPAENHKATSAVGLSPLLSMCSPSTISDMVRKRALNIEASIGRVQFEDTEAAITNLLNFHPEQALSHYLRYLNCLHHREFPGALDSLHRYFDYAMVEKWGKDFVQYAIINLAALHHSFGHRELR